MIRRAWLEHIVLCFPDQDFDAEALNAFAGRFGTLDDNRAAPDIRHPDLPAVSVLVNNKFTVKEKDYASTAASYWHSDLSYTTHPSTASFLNAKVLPPVGGDTMFANMYVAYETLSPRFKEMIDGLESVHDTSISYVFKRLSPELQEERRKLSPPTVHPLVRVHPETGRKALFLGSRIRRFVGMTEEETAPLLRFLDAHATRYEFVYRHRWKVNDLIMWDNRAGPALRGAGLRQARAAHVAARRTARPRIRLPLRRSGGSRRGRT